MSVFRFSGRRGSWCLNVLITMRMCAIGSSITRIYYFAILNRWRQKTFSVFKNQNIPGPPPSLLFGNLLELRKKVIRVYRIPDNK